MVGIQVGTAAATSLQEVTYSGEKRTVSRYRIVGVIHDLPH